jgi:putative ABC transport system substrate-binding protein
MRRREFMTLLGGAATTWPLTARAQQPPKVPTIGFLGAGTSSVWSQWTAAFVQRLRELGWVEGRTVTIEYRRAEGRPERYSEIATEFARLKVDVIATVGSAVPATMQVTSTIPIVFAIAVDPFGTGMVASLAKPGGNVTGLSMQTIELPGKRIELLRAVLPDLRRLAVLANVSYPGAVHEAAEVQAAADKFGIEIEMLEIRRAEDIAPCLRETQERSAGHLCMPGCTDKHEYRSYQHISTRRATTYGPRFPRLSWNGGLYVLRSQEY